MTVFGQNGKLFLAVIGDSLAENGRKVAVTFEDFRRVANHRPSYIKKAPYSLGLPDSGR
jgi:hypothetical protein